MPLSCADLFCGAGGFSEGFRQAGFRVTTAVDLWRPAALTHQKEHPDTRVLRTDVLELDPERIGPVDVLVGSPPCQEFSLAKRGGSGDVARGMRLVYRFLRFVYELQPTYWVMENVPRVRELLPPEVPLRALGIDKRGSLEIPVREVLVSADYGVPQKRSRLFSGHFPIPSPTHADVPTARRPPWRTLRDVVETLPDPVRPPSVAAARDPIYGFDLPVDQLTAHFSDGLELTPDEIRDLRKAKLDHSWYGRMPFPDELDRPARTVMAAQFRRAREVIVVPSSTGGFRRPSVREASSLQGFPITYQWWGASEGQSYYLIGNAVPPPMAFAIAKAIAAALEARVPRRPRVRPYVIEPAPAATTARRPVRYALDRRFRDHVPGSKAPGLRVDVDNRGAARPNRGWTVRGRRPRHLVEWRALLVRGQGDAMRQEAIDVRGAVALLAKTIAERDSEDRARSLVRALARELTHAVPDASTLQAVRAERCTGTSIQEVLERAAEIVDRHYPAANLVHIRPPAGVVPPKVAATLVAAAYACALANEGSAWIEKNRTDAYRPDERARPTRGRSVDWGHRLDTQLDRALQKGRRERGRVPAEQLAITWT